MQDSITYLLARLEQGEADQRDIESIRVLLSLRVDSGQMTSELYTEVLQYVENLVEDKST